MGRNKELQKIYMAGYRAENKERIAAQRKEYCANYYKENKDKISKHRKTYKREYDLKRNFGLTVSEYDAMLEAQKGCCAICATPQSLLPIRLAVDHCHKTGKIRGLLCNPCNKGIGNLKDDKQVILNALTYLNQHSTNTNN